MEHSNSIASQLITTIDIFPQTICFGEIANNQAPLLLPRHSQANINASDNNDAIAFADIISSYKQAITDRLVVFGHKQDPFNNPKSSLATTLKTLEAIVALKPKKLLIQTRSPHIILALPLLRAMNDSVGVTIALETDSDDDNLLLGLDLPRPSERLKTARLLKNINIPVRIQYAPFPSATRCFDVRVTTHLMNRCSHKLRVLPLSAIAPAGEQSSTYDTIDWKLCENAYFQARDLCNGQQGVPPSTEHYQEQAAA